MLIESFQIVWAVILQVTRTACIINTHVCQQVKCVGMALIFTMLISNFSGILANLPVETFEMLYQAFSLFSRLAEYQFKMSIQGKIREGK